MKTSLSLIIMCLFNLGLVSHANAAHFVDPKWNGYALDWCKDFEQGCGAPAADQFCQDKGYPTATAFQIWPQVNFPTMTIGQNAICNPADHRCDAFASIDCKETVKTFPAPTINGYRLDWCREFSADCGAPAALEYCQKSGYADLVNFQKQSALTVPTMIIGDNAVCNPKFHGCDSFTYIQCKN